MEAVTSYLPASILSYLLENSGQPLTPPARQSYKTSVLFADVTGYTALCEAVSAKGAGGDEYLAKHLNSYFELLVRTMSSQGGDVFKFAGDAIIVLWPPSEENLETLTRRAAQCALEIKKGLQGVQLAPGITLSVKVGVGVGEISILHVGGVFGRMEYVATGQPLIQAFNAEHHCEKPDVVVSPEAWALIKDFFLAEIHDGHAFLEECQVKIKKISVFKTTNSNKNLKEEVLKKVGQYVPSAVLPFIPHHEEKWASELRRITVLFVNLGMKESDLNAVAREPAYINVVHTVLQAVQSAVYKYEGSLNKFLMDDKGSTLIAVFGLPPLAHEDDSIRGILSAITIECKLQELGFRPAIGVTTGMAFCGVVGSRGRREYSVLGDTVNLAARLMQHATKQGGGTVCDTMTVDCSSRWMQFTNNGQISVKGKAKPVSIWEPKGGLNGQGERGRRKKQENEQSLSVQQCDLIQSSIIQSLAQRPLLNANSHSSLLIPSSHPSLTPFNLHCLHLNQVLSFDNVNEGIAPSPHTFYSLYPERIPYVLHKKVYALHIILPDGLGDLLLSVVHLENIQQVYEEIGILCRKRNLLSTSINYQDYFLSAIDENNEHVSGDIDIALAHLVSKKQAQFQTYRQQYPSFTFLSNHHFNNDMPSPPSTFYQSDVYTLLLCEREVSEEFGFPFENNRALSKQHDHLFHSIQHLIFSQSAPTFSPSHPRIASSPVFLVEGDAGLGKSRLLYSVLSNASPNTPFISSSCPPTNNTLAPPLIVCTNGNPFEMMKSFGSFQDILSQLLDFQIEKLHIQSSFADPTDALADLYVRFKQMSTSLINPAFKTIHQPENVQPPPQFVTLNSFTSQQINQLRQAIVQQMLSHAPHTFEGIQNIAHYGALLNESFSFDIPTNDDVSSLDAPARQPILHSLLLYLIHCFTLFHPLVLVFDDAIFLDTASWNLILSLSRSVSNLSLIASLRPMNKSYMAAFQFSVPAAYTTLLNEPQVIRLTLSFREDDSMEAIIRSLMDKDYFEGDLPDAFIQLITKKAHGSPLVVREIITTLKKEGMMTVEDDEVKFDPSFNFTQIHANPAVNIPIFIQNVLGCRIDRLSHVQRMLLKCAALIGDEFSFNSAHKVYPLNLDDSSVFEKELKSLLDLKILKMLDAHDVGHSDESSSFVPSSSSAATALIKTDNIDYETVKFSFTDGFLREMFLSRMLKYQKKALDEKVSETRLQFFTKKIAASAQVMAHTEPQIASVLYVKDTTDAATSDYKLRYFALFNNLLYAWGSQEQYNEKKDPISIYFLDEASTTEDLGGSHDFGFLINCMIFQERDVIVHTPTTLYFAALNEKELVAWGEKLHKQVDRVWMGKIPIKKVRDDDDEEEENVNAPLSPVEGNKEDDEKATADSSAESKSEQKANGDKRVDIASLSKEEKDSYERKFISAIENRMSPILMPYSALFIRKQSPSSSLFSGDWKSRQVSLLDDALIVKEKKTDKWVRPIQSFSLIVGSPQASMMDDPFDQKQKTFKFQLEVELWMKGMTIIWGKRTVVFGASTLDEAKKWTEKINEIIFKHKVMRDQDKKHVHRLSAWGLQTKKPAATKPGPVRAAAPTISTPRTRNNSVMHHGTSLLPNLNANFAASSSSSSPPTTTHTLQVPQSPVAAPLPENTQPVLAASSNSEGITIVVSQHSPDSQTTPPASNPSPPPAVVTEVSPPLSPSASSSNTFQHPIQQITNDHQLDSVFESALYQLDNQPNITADSMKELIQQLQHKVQALVVTSSNAQSPSNASLPSGDSSAAPADSENQSLNFAEALDQCDIDNTTKSWLTSNYTTEAVSLKDSAAEVVPVEPAAATPAPTTPASQSIATSSLPYSPSILVPTHPTTPVSPSVFGPISSLSDYVTFDCGDLTSWDWCVFDFDPTNLLPVIVKMYHHFNFFEMFKVEIATFARWVRQVQHEYFDNPFHNFYHAADVCQSVFSMLTAMEGETYLNQLEKFSILTAALCHDLRHPGLTNNYHITARTPLAMLYNDQSVLEHHHCASTFRIFDKPEFNILSNLTPQEYKHVRSCLTNGILNTDMTLHFTLIEKFNNLMADQEKLGLGHVQPAKDLSDANRLIIFNVILHSSDISNPSKAWPMQKRWSDAVTTEFFNEGDMMKMKGLPISPNSDRNTTEQSQLSINFIDFVVAPIFVGLRNLLPQVQKCCVHIKQNRLEWMKIWKNRIQDNPNRNEEEKQAELARWERRTESFHDIMLPPENVIVAQKHSVHQELLNVSLSKVSLKSNTSTPLAARERPTVRVGSAPASPATLGSSFVTASPISQRNSIIMLNKFMHANSKAKSTQATSSHAQPSQPSLPRAQTSALTPSSLQRTNSHPTIHENGEGH